jgi:hypothetical protein
MFEGSAVFAMGGCMRGLYVTISETIFLLNILRLRPLRPMSPRIIFYPYIVIIFLRRDAKKGGRREENKKLSCYDHIFILSPGSKRFTVMWQQHKT